MQEMTSQVYLQGDAEAASVNLDERVPHMEERFPIPGALAGIDRVLKTQQPHSRLMKTHLPACIFQKQLSEGKCKFIVVMRNVKDNLVSYYHFHRALIRYKGTWSDFFEAFKAKQLLWGDWLDYNLGWWALKHHPNVLIVKYEDMKKNRREVIQKAAEFCKKTVSEETLDKIAAATSFEAMRDNPATNYMNIWHPQVIDYDICPFMRKGDVGDWKEYFSDEQNTFVEEHYLREAARHGLYFECDV